MMLLFHLSLLLPRVLFAGRALARSRVTESARVSFEHWNAVRHHSWRAHSTAPLLSTARKNQHRHPRCSRMGSSVFVRCRQVAGERVQGALLRPGGLLHHTITPERHSSIYISTRAAALSVGHCAATSLGVDNHRVWTGALCTQSSSSSSHERKVDVMYVCMYREDLMNHNDRCMVHNNNLFNFF